MGRSTAGSARLHFVLLLAAAALTAGAACGRKAKVQTPKAPPPASRTAGRPASTPPIVPQPGSATLPGEAIPVPVPEMPAPTPGPDVPFTVRESPAIRIGLDTDATEVRISSSGKFYLLDKAPEAVRRAVEGEVRVRVEREGEAASTYRVQLASFSSESPAEELRKRAAARLAVPVSVYNNPDNRRYQVRAGDFATREQAQQFAEGPLRRAGFSDYFVVRESGPSEGGVLVLALRGQGNLFHLSKAGFIFFPSSTSMPLRVERKTYRGFLELMLNKSGRITVVNQLGIEEYLLGVVPAEISPDSYPEYAALAAQSVAARTYALKHMGQFREDGFDLTDDVKTQVYAGISGEKEAADLAVFKTYGLAIYYQGQLIDAMYSSTCGGRTEDFANVFDAPAVPYLKGVVCTAEAGAEGERFQVQLSGKHDFDKPVFAADGTIANRHLELARLLGLGGSGPEPVAYYEEPASKGELIEWVAWARRVVGKPDRPASPPAGDLTSRAGFLAYAADAIFGSQEIERRTSRPDADYYLANLSDGDSIRPEARLAVAYLIQNGLWHADPENRAVPGAPIRRADALALLSQWIESVRPGILRQGTFVGMTDNAAKGDAPGISVKSGRSTQNLPLSDEIRLFLAGKGTITPTDSVKIIGNEKLSFHLSESGKVDLMEVELNPSGAASDRYSPAANWNVTMARPSLADKLRPLSGEIGELRDLKPAKLGTSGRAVRIEVIGSRRSVVLNGYKVRNALGLRDTLFTITRTVGADGSIDSFTFHGRGWGHGVGLCQVGAFGMARAGKSYEEILKSYYTGVEIRRAY